MPQKSNPDFKKKYPYIRVDTLEPMRIHDILTKFNNLLPYIRILEYDCDK